METSYVKKPQITQSKPKEVVPVRELSLKSPVKINAAKLAPPPFVEKPPLSKPAFIKPVSLKPDIIAVKKKITLPPIELDKINNPSYISYYQIIREKIKRTAYQNYTRAEVGEVYLSFIISKDGYLNEAQLIEEKSSPNSYLKEIASRSIKDASPFPAFPKELDYPQLSFNVVISFEIE